VKRLALVAALLLPASPAAATAPVPYSDASPATGPTRGYVITIHPGGWRIVGEGPAGLMNPEVARLNAWGYETLNVDHRRGHRALADVTRFYDRLRRRVGNMPICLDGWSSGGHLALLVAARRPRVACVISLAGPAHLPSLPKPLIGLAHRFFDDRGGLLDWSPTTKRIRAPILLGHARADKTVPFDQAMRMVATHPRARLVALGRGRAPYVHGRVSRADLERFHTRQRRFLRRHSQQH
jgi:pimeloyl-ACP methyl ester carboxylesterase